MVTTAFPRVQCPWQALFVIKQASEPPLQAGNRHVRSNCTKRIATMSVNMHVHLVGRLQIFQSAHSQNTFGRLDTSKLLVSCIYFDSNMTARGRSSWYNCCLCEAERWWSRYFSELQFSILLHHFTLLQTACRAAHMQGFAVCNSP